MPALARSPRRLRSCLTALVLASLAPNPLFGCAATHAVVPPASDLPAVDAKPETPPPPPVPEPPPPQPPLRPELPLGGRELFPAYRLVGFCGTPGGPALGPLDGNLPARAKKLATFAAQYGDDRKVMQVFELIAVVVMGLPGADGKWRRRVPNSVVDDFLAQARASKGLLLINIQPGQSDFMTELKHYERYLREPDVGVTLDPEWAMKHGHKPGVFWGETTAKEINEVAAYLAGIVKEGDLPEKALVFHQVNRAVFREDAALTQVPGVVMIKSVDGLGPKGTKIVTYKILTDTMSAGVHPGFKLFFEEDTRNGGALMTPKDVMRLTPLPDYVMYE